ncbi:MAG: galactokinase [Bacteroidota bacterium]
MNEPRAAVEETAAATYRNRFGSPPSIVASAPGRVNLIGEHTDYNEGFVFPAAIDRSIAVAVGPRNDGRLVMCSASMQGETAFALDRLFPSERRAWTDYLVGVAALLRERHGSLRPANICVHGVVPRGSGLSSSAALELATAFGLIAFNGIDIPPLDIITLCQRAEHEYAGVLCGIMDQFISCLGKRSHALMLDCRSLEYELVPIPPGVVLLVCDTGVRRALASSAYNQRRSECAEGVRLFASHRPGISALRDVTDDDLNAHASELTPVVLKRCRHVIHENARVVRSARALREGDLSEFGKLMYDSHLSLRDDYEVSCAELDAVVDICAEAEGVFGARMTGAGFGGSAICLAREEAASEITARLLKEYPRTTGKSPSVYVCAVDDGATARVL